MRRLAPYVEVYQIFDFFRVVDIVMIDGESQVGLYVKIAQLLTIRVISIDDPTHKGKGHLLLQFVLLI